MAGTPIIEAEDVTKRFGEHQVLTRVRLPVIDLWVRSCSR